MDKQSVGNLLRELRFYDARLSQLPDSQSRFYTASKLVDFVVKTSGAEIVSWCVEGNEIILLAQGGDLRHFPTLRPASSKREELIEAAENERQRALQYLKASDKASDPYTCLGYLDLARDAENAAQKLSKEAEAWGNGGVKLLELSLPKDAA